MVTISAPIVQNMGCSSPIPNGLEEESTLHSHLQTGFPSHSARSCIFLRQW